MTTTIDLQATHESLRAIAAAQVAQYPQYRGHFTGYRLVRIKCDVKTKAGLAFARGEYAIATDRRDGLAFARGEYAIATDRRDELPGLPSSGRFVTVWSRRNKIDTSVRVSDVEWL